MTAQGIKYSELVPTVQTRLESFKLSVPLSYNVSMSELTTFRVGGIAEVLARPRNTDELSEVLLAARELGIRPFILGGGANIVVADDGVSGIVIHTGSLSGISVEKSSVRAGAGEQISDVSHAAADAALSGLDFIYAMPGSTGGAVWMNARCYDGEIAGILGEVKSIYIDGERVGEVERYVPRAEDFAYKISPFQDGRRVITEVRFDLMSGPDGSEAIWRRMEHHEADRRAKGHFHSPCAGSIFKNNRAFGEPSGKIIDRCGLRGRQVGGARISDWHGNIIINTGDATASDIHRLMTETREQVYRDTGFLLEPEVLFVGDWT